MLQAAVLCLCFVAAHGFVVPATTLVRAPSHDSAIIRSDRLGGNFAYSVHEGHAYAAVSPVVQHVQTPVAVSYHAAPLAYHAAPVAFEAPKVEIKTVELPEVKALPLAYAAHPYAYAAHPVALEAPKIEYKTIETPAEFKTLAYPYAGYGYPYGAYPFTVVKAAEKSE